ncbi:MAG: hypothetical protein A2901_02460 [Elusimicrobia bacterium RIFCSPLOWO2_01_FULL_54_10]|nr:MAG: hypothetical protein A2901_02460 [Elusimicrobia bacterium RIFCSPLOWO2_01_FULL_54_10]
MTAVLKVFYRPRQAFLDLASSNLIPWIFILWLSAILFKLNFAPLTSTIKPLLFNFEKILPWVGDRWFIHSVAILLDGVGLCFYAGIFWGVGRFFSRSNTPYSAYWVCCTLINAYAHFFMGLIYWQSIHYAHFGVFAWEIVMRILILIALADIPGMIAMLFYGLAGMTYYAGVFLFLLLFNSGINIIPSLRIAALNPPKLGVIENNDAVYDWEFENLNGERFHLGDFKGQAIF